MCFATLGLVQTTLQSIDQPSLLILCFGILFRFDTIFLGLYSLSNNFPVTAELGNLYILWTSHPSITTEMGVEGFIEQSIRSLSG